jgi:hypothetical protein
VVLTVRENIEVYYCPEFIHDFWASKNRDISYGRQTALKRHYKIKMRFREIREIDNTNLQVFMLICFALMRYKIWIEDS